jgi:tRNA uridine 5-carbamoylmethylation protein Kti12
MSCFIIIRGSLGSGKTTISKKLASILNAVRIGMDDILEEHNLDSMIQGASNIPVKNFIKANEIILPSVKEYLSQGKIVIFDGCFYYKESIENLIENLPFSHYVFTLKAPLQVCIERDRQRSKSYGIDAARIVYFLVSKFDYGMPIDVVKSCNENIKDILTHLDLNNI